MAYEYVYQTVSFADINGHWNLSSGSKELKQKLEEGFEIADKVVIPGIASEVYPIAVFILRKEK